MMQFKLKELIIFFLVFAGGSFVGAFVNNYFGLTTGEGLVAYFIAMFVPVLFVYLIWKNWGETASA